MIILKTLNAILAFSLELVMFFSIAFFGYTKGSSPVFKWVFAIAGFIVAATLWGIFAAPKSEMRLGVPLRFVFELAMFLTSAYLLYKLNYTTLALLMAVLSLLSVGLAYALKQ